MLALAAALRPTLGPGHPDLIIAYEDAYEACSEIGDRDNLFTALNGASHARWARGGSRRSRGDTDTLIELAGSDQSRLVMAHMSAAETLHFAGEIEPAL